MSIFEIEQTYESLKTDRDNLRAFIAKFIPSECWGIDAFDGGDVQDTAEAMGIIVKVEHQQPCEIDECNCEGEDFMYHLSWDKP